MSRLGAALGPGRGDDHVLIRTEEGALEAGSARAGGPALALGPDDVVAVCVRDPANLVALLAALDSRVTGLLLLSPSFAPATVAALAEAAGATAIVSDRTDLDASPPVLAPSRALARAPAGDGATEAPDDTRPNAPTAWLMTTSGTTGLPKIVPHDLASLTRSVRRDPRARVPVWGLLYDPTRFAGLQVTLQSLLGGGTLVAPPLDAPLARQIEILARGGVTHLSATPTLWRRLLMAPGIETLALDQVTLGGEIADQAVLEAVATRFPDARITHIYASTEAGVGFAVNDRQAGFPLSFQETRPGGVGVRVVDGQLWLKPPGDRVARYLGGRALEIDAEGFVATGDRIEIRGRRAHFLGRDSGVINVGGVKVHPERVERTIAEVPGVGLVRVTAKSSPITGALLVATVVPAADADRAALKDAIFRRCRDGLEREAVPARVTFVAALDVNAAGKIVRN